MPSFYVIFEGKLPDGVAGRVEVESQRRVNSQFLQRRQVFYSGNVQGVGFRYSTHRIAQDFEVTGFVRNLPDGRVELIAEGSKPQLNDFLATVAAQMSEQIRSVQCDTRPAIDEFHRFDIRY